MSETIAIPSAGDVRKKLTDTGLLARVTSRMGEQPNHHPTGLAQFQVDPGVAGDAEVTAVLEKLNSSGEWAARVINVAGETALDILHTLSRCAEQMAGSPLKIVDSRPTPPGNRLFRRLRNESQSA